MKREKFHNLVKGYSEMAAKEPARFRRQVRVLVTAAFVYLAAVFALLVWVVTWCLGYMIIGEAGLGKIILFVFSGLSLLAGLVGLLSRSVAPGGRRLGRDDAPALFEQVDTLRREMQVGKISSIWVDGSCNAYAFQRPLFGLIGMTRCDLVFGLPLLAAIPPGEFRAVIAHELAHFAKNHGVWHQWLYRFWMAWRSIAQSVLTGLLLLPFEKIAGARLLAAISVHFRGYEYEADAQSAELLGNELMAKALVRLQVNGADFEERFYAELSRETATNAEPPEDVMTRAVAFIKSVETGGGPVRRQLRSEFGRAITFEDTHPSLFDRLRELRVLKPGASPGEAVDRALSLISLVTDATALSELIRKPEWLVDVGNQEWKKEVDADWEEGRKQAAAACDRLAALERRLGEGGPALVEVEEWERVELVFLLKGDEEGRVALEKFIERFPNHAFGGMTYAGLLYKDEDERCLAFAERAAKNDGLHRPGYVVLQQQWLRENGQVDEADSIDPELFRQHEAYEKATAERLRMGWGARYKAHNLSETIVARLVEQLAEYPQITRAYLVERKLKLAPERPGYIIAVKFKRVWWKWESTAYEQGLMEKMVAEVTFPYDWVVISMGGVGWITRRRIKRTAGSLVYKKRKG